MLKRLMSVLTFYRVFIYVLPEVARAVDVDNRAGQEVRAFRRQKADRVRNLFGFRDAAERALL
jgi:hypothetical protein